MKRHVLLTLFLLITVGAVSAHDPGAPPPTWNREISRIVYERCASCHRPGGSSFSLMTYPEAQLKAVAIKTAVLSRRMPPWGAVKGFGDFRNDSGLTQEQLSLITDWVEGGTPRGNNPNALPPPPKFDKAPSPFKTPAHTIAVSGDVVIKHAVVLDGMLPEHAAQGASMQIVADMPDRGIEPLLWLYEYKDSYRHPFLFRRSIDLPAGAVIRGVPPNATIRLLAVAGSKP